MNDDHETGLDTNTKIITYLYLVISFISVVFSIICVIFYYKYTYFKNNYAAKLIVLLSIADIFGWTPGIITSLQTIIENQTQNEFSESGCVFMAIWKTFFNNMTNVCVLMIAVFLYININLERNPHDFQKRCYILAFFIIVVLTVIPLAIDEYGDVDGSTCWIKGYYMRLGVFYIPFIVMVFLDIVLTGITIHKIRKINGQKKSLIVKFISFPVIMIFCWGPGTVKRILDNFMDENDLIVLKYIMYINMPLQGILNPIAYLFINDSLRSKLKSILLLKENENENEMVNSGNQGEALLIEDYDRNSSSNRMMYDVINK